MPMPCNLEKTIIDNLVICYLAPTELLGWLKQTDNSCYGDFRMYRAEGRFHRHYFHLFTDDYRRLGDIYFERYASKGNELYLWLKVENSLLYDQSYLEVIDQVSAQWELEFNVFTSLDLARDFGYDVAARIRKMMRREDLAVMVNGKEVRDRDKTLKGVYRTCGISLAKDGTKGLTIKQAKAARNKHLGITLDCYNKTEEIENASGKQYIRDFYGQRKRLHRLEMRMNCEQIKRACKKTKTRYQLDLITQQESLDAIFIYALQFVLRFRHGRKVLQWEDLFKCGIR